MRHRGHVQVGSVAFGERDLAEAKRVADADEPDRDLYQRVMDGSLPERLPFSMVGPAAGLVLVSIVITFVAGPLFGFTDRAAEDLMERTPYFSSVLGEDTP